jgi:transcription-repair coupling factor (superfamily II helicase)
LLRKLVPEARIGFAHGQMDPDDLERILARFADHELDVLVTTAIIESGIDMPRVNTMIVNRADSFGLAQLYQLRGRIGRGMVRGHCTLLVGGAGAVRREAMERLRALQRHSTLGSGFALASEDLEQRGGGDILGEKQHGHIAAIGFDAYVQLLEEATHKVRGEVVRAQIEPELEVSVPAVIPEAWIPDTGDRLDLYQRLAIAHDERQLDAVVRDAESEWGALPEEVSNLVGLTRLKLRCRALGVVELRVLRVRAVAKLHDATTVRLATVDALCKKSPNRFRRTGMEVEARFTPEEGAFPLRVAEWVLSAVSGKA